MDVAWWGWGAAVAAAAFVVGVGRARASGLNVVLLGVAVLCGYLWLLGRAGRLSWELGVLAVSLVAVAVTALVLPVALVLNGVLLWVRAWRGGRPLRRGPGHVVSLVVGLGLGAVVLTVPTIALLGPRWVLGPLAGVVLAVAYLGFAALLLLVYALLYRLLVRAVHPGAVVVLGAGLHGRRPSPVLARRLDRAHRVWRRDRDRTGGDGALLVVSGGQGPDEEVAESTAMADYLADQGVPRAVIVEEDRAANTVQNLRYSAALLAAHGDPTPVVAVTSDFHVLRTALLARRLGLRVDVVGAPTAPFYRVGAALRELAGILWSHRVAHLVVVLVLLAAPTVVALLVR